MHREQRIESYQNTQFYSFIILIFRNQINSFQIIILSFLTSSFFGECTLLPLIWKFQNGKDFKYFEDQFQLRDQSEYDLQVLLFLIHNQKDLMALKSTNLLNSAQLILSNIGDSKKYSVGKNQQNELYFNLDIDCNLYGQAFLNFNLDPSANYVIQVKLEQQIGKNKDFYFGITIDSHKNATLGYNKNLCYYEQNGIHGVNTLVKGQSILTNDNSLVSRSLEVRINIQKKILRVGSLPNYDSVVQADQPERINSATPYRFFLAGLEEGSKMTITKLETVSQFDSNM